MPRGIKGTTIHSICHLDRKHYAKGLCKQCYMATPEAKAKRLAWQKINSDKHLKINQEYRKSHPEKYKDMTRNNNRTRNGWTQESVEVAIAMQNNSCAICKTLFTEIRMHADHEHTMPPKPRGLLCGLCNKGLGQFKDSPVRLEAAAMYLRQWGK